MNCKSILSRINIKESLSEIPGILAITRDETDDSVLLEIVCQSSELTFRNKISQSDLPTSHLLPESSTPWEFLKSQLTSYNSLADSQYHTKYELHEQEITLQISHRMISGIIRVVWESILKTEKNRSSGYNFTEQLFQICEDRKTSYDELEVAFHQLEKHRDDWKDTAEKLENVWANEKSELLENFLILYKKQQELTANAQERCRELEAMLETNKKSQEEDATKRTKTYQNNKMTTSMLNDEPDDLNTEIYSKELVAKLAGTESKEKSGRGQKLPSSMVVPKKARNKATGAIEYFDEDEALADLELESKGRAPPKQNIEPPQERNSKLPASRRKIDPPKKMRKLNSKKDDNASDSSGTYSDSELDSSVLAQLAAIKNMED